MSMDLISKRYAESLFLASENSDRQELLQALKTLSSGFLVSETRALLCDPSIAANVKLEAMLEAVKTSPESSVVSAFLKTILKADRLELLPDIAIGFESLTQAKLGIEKVSVSTAIPLSQALKENLIEKLQKSLSGKVVLQESVQPDLVGGMILEFNGKQLDLTVRRRLDSMATLASES